MKKLSIKDHRHESVDLYKISNGCSICGYNTHPSSLCFDHLPGSEKSDVVKNGYSKKPCAGGMYRLYAAKSSTEDLIAEIKKCRILCVRCHMEITHSKNKRTRNQVTEMVSSIEQLESRLRKVE